MTTKRHLWIPFFGAALLVGIACSQSDGGGSTGGDGGSSGGTSDTRFPANFCQQYGTQCGASFPADRVTRCQTNCEVDPLSEHDLHDGDCWANACGVELGICPDPTHASANHCADQQRLYDCGKRHGWNVQTNPFVCIPAGGGDAGVVGDGGDCRISAPTSCPSNDGGFVCCSTQAKCNGKDYVLTCDSASPCICKTNGVQTGTTGSGDCSAAAFKNGCGYPGNP